MKPKEGRFSAEPDKTEVDNMIERVKSGECDWSHWKDWLVLGQYDEGKLEEIVVAKVIRSIPTKGE